MRALVQEGSNSADVLHIREIDRPELSDDGVLIRVHAASVNALDWHTTRGGRGFAIIAKLMRQAPPPRIRGVDVAATTALQAVRDHGRVRLADRVLVHGAGGGVGTFAVHFAKALGAHVTVVTSARNVELVQSLAPDRAFVLSEDGFRQQHYDLIVDVASTRSIRSMLRLLTASGRYVVTGAPKGSTIGLLLRVIGARVLARFDRRVVNFDARIKRDDLAAVARMVVDGKLSLHNASRADYRDRCPRDGLCTQCVGGAVAEGRRRCERVGR